MHARVRLVAPALALALVLGTGLAPSASLSANPLATSVGVSMSNDFHMLDVDGRRAVFAASEGGEGQDLNGDGDQLDVVLHAYDAATGSLYNHGVGVELDIAVHGDVVLYAASERQNGVDYNNDGDKFDGILHQATFDGSQPTNWLVPTVDIIFEEAFAVIAISEIGGTQDLNGDGDRADDHIVALFDPQRGKIGVLRRAAMNFGTVATTPSAVVFQVDELRDGRDHNADGDQLDQVVFTHNLTSGKTTNSKRQSQVVRTSTPGRHHHAGPLIGILTDEAEHGADLNGDGDLLDDVPAVIDTATGKIVAEGLPGHIQATASSWRVVGVHEAQHGKDINGDGDALDRLVTFEDHASGASWSADLALPFTSRWTTVDPAPNGLVVTEISEAASGGQDLNGDGDAQDALLTAFDPDLGSADVWDVSSACASDVFSTPRLSGAHALACTRESDVAQDLNGDGDVLDLIAQGVNLLTGAVHTSGMAMKIQSADGQAMIGKVAHFVAYEVAQSEDLNGDGDQLDVVIHRLDASTGASTTTGLVPFFVANNPRWLSGTHEQFARVREGNHDYNGDGDKTDLILFALR